MVTITLPRVTITKAPRLDNEPAALEQIVYGLQNGFISREMRQHDPIEEFWYESLEEYDDVVADWERVVSAAAEEIAPEVARMFTAAVQRRLPWTGEGRGVSGKAPVAR